MFVVAHRVNRASVMRSLNPHKTTHVEVDVRLTGGQVVLSHFQKVVWAPWLERDNARLRIGKGPPLDAPLAEVLDLIPAGAVVVFDPKDREPALRRRLAIVLATTVPDPSSHVVSSRRPDDLARFSALGFRTWLTLDTADQLKRAAADAFAFDGVTARHRALSAQAVRALHDVTDTVTAWTVRTERRALELIGFGVDGITTSSPAVMDAVMREQ